MTTPLPPRSVLVWSVLISVLATAASVAGLLIPSIYARENRNWALQAQGQDLGNLIAIVVLLVAAVLMGRGVRWAGPVWLGTLAYLVYAYAVYAFALHFNEMFLVYVSVLGLSAYALLFNFSALAGVTPPPDSVRRFAGGLLVALGCLFALLWLGEDIPALLAGTVPQSVKDAALIVNPVHVIDLAIVLPGFVVAGVASLRGRGQAAALWTAPWLAFSVLMGLSIIFAMVLMAANGFGGILAPTVMVSAVVLASLVALWLWGRGSEGPRRGGQPLPESADVLVQIGGRRPRA